LSNNYYIVEPNTPSKAVNEALVKLNKQRRPPRVNLPALARRDERLMECILPARKGDVFISSDFTALEPSITSQYSKDEYYTYASYTGVGKKPYIDDKGVLRIPDVYLMFASVDPRFKNKVLDFFSKDENCQLWLDNPDIIKDKYLKKERKKSKPAVLGFGYGMGWKKFISQSFDAGDIVTPKESKGAHKAYWKLFKDIADLAKKLEIQLTKKGHIVNQFGYRMTTESHKGYNAMIQSSASGVVDLLCLDFFPRCPEATFVSLVHDEVIYSCSKENIEVCRSKQAESVKWLNKTLQFDIPMRLGFQIAPTFAQMK